MSQGTAIAVGTPCWWELATNNTEAAQAFYAELCGWTSFVDDGGGMPYHHWKRGEDMFGGMYDLSNIPGMDQVPSHWGTYFHSDDVDATVSKAIELGATMCKDPMDIPDTGRMAVITDPTGAHFMLFSPAANKPSTGVPDVIVWNELMTTDPKAALSFYTSLFGWNIEDMPMGDGTYRIIKNGDVGFGGCMKITAEMGETPPHWMPYIGTDDIQATVAKAVELGATTTMPVTEIDPTVGWCASVTDPTGANISFYQSAKQS